MNPINSTISRAALQTQVANVETQQEAVRSQRDSARTDFQSSEQKGAQLLDLLVAAVRAQVEQRSIGPGSRSGL